MKRLLVYVIFLISTLDLYAQEERFRILYINTTNINIGGKSLVVGNEFDSNDVIRWESEKQAIRVISLLTNKQYTLSSVSISGRKSLASYLKNNKNLSTRPGYSASLLALSQAIPPEIYLLDRVEFATSVLIDDEHFFYASYIKNGEIINKKLTPITQGGFALDRRIWQIDGVSHTPYKMKISIHYYDMVKSQVTDLATDVLLTPLAL